MLERAETALVGGLARGAKTLPPGIASTLCGRLAGMLGPLLPVSQVAHGNLRRALPELDEAGRRRVVREAWTQLGRTIGEFPHVPALRQTSSGPGWEVVGQDVLARLPPEGPVIFFSGHIGNWEILPHAAGASGLRGASFSRAAQNAGVDDLIRRMRRPLDGSGPQMFAKGAAGARQAMAHLRQGGRLALLVDQKLNDGVQARFFGRPAMTSPAAAAFALHFRCPVVPALAQRIGPARLRLVVEEPLILPGTGDRAADVLALTQRINDVLERWIRADPGSWLWLHRRWPPEDA